VPSRRGDGAVCGAGRWDGTALVVACCAAKQCVDGQPGAGAVGAQRGRRGYTGTAIDAVCARPAFLTAMCTTFVSIAAFFVLDVLIFLRGWHPFALLHRWMR